MIALVTLVLGAAASSGIHVGATHVATWHHSDLATAPLSDPEALEPAPALDGHPILDVVRWGDGFAVLERQSPMCPHLWFVAPGPGGGATELDGCWLSITTHPSRPALLAFGPGGEVHALDHPDSAPEVWLIEGLVHPGWAMAWNDGVLVADNRALWWVGLPSGEPVATATRGLGMAQIRYAVPAGDGRLLAVGRLKRAHLLERWSVLEGDTPLPVPLGVRRAGASFAASLPLDHGVWLPTEGPLRPHEAVERVWIGGAPSAVEAVARHPTLADQALLMDGDGNLLTAPLPRLPEAPPPTPVEADGALLHAWDLPVGQPVELAQLSAVMRRPPEVEEHRAHHVAVTPMERPWPTRAVDRFTRGVNGFSNSHRAQYATRWARDLGRTTRRFHPDLVAHFVLLALFSLPSWLAAALYLSSRGRIAPMLMEPLPGLSRWHKVIANDHNPFRQDHPDDVTGTPFAHHPFVEELHRALTRNHVVVEAPLFSGKSMLLAHLAWRLEERGLDDHPVKVVHLSLEDVSEQAFWTVLGRGIADRFPDAPASEEVMALDDLDRAAVEYLLEELVDARDSDARIVLAIDDLDVLARYTTEGQRFRGLLQMVPELTVLGTAVALRRGAPTAADESPWFNIFQVRKLRPMQPAEIDDYLALRLRDGFSYDRSVPEWVFTATGGRPLLVWLLCASAVEDLITDFVIHRRLRLTSADITETVTHLRRAAGAGPDDQLDPDLVRRQLTAARIDRGLLEARISRPGT